MTITRDDLVEAATELVDERGYEGAAMAEVARRTGVATSAVYANFRDKAELLLEAAAAAQSAQNALLLRLYDGTDDLDHIRDDFLADAASWVDPERARERAVMVEARMACVRDARVRERLLDLEATRIETVEEAVRVLQQSAIANPDVDAEAVAAMLVAIPLGLAVLERTGIELPSRAAWSSLIDHLVNALLLGPEGRALFSVSET